MRKTFTLLFAVLAAALLAPLTASAQGASSVDVQFNGLEPLGAASIYEGWLIIDGSPYSTGTFNVDAAGNFVNVQNVEVPNAADASAYVLTIEPAVDPDPAPSSTHILAGDFANGSAQLTIGHPAALGTDFASAGGTYIIATPTTDATDDDLSGVWFLDPTGADGPVASLDLPELPAGWVYEGWAVINGVPVSTGRFLTASGGDDFGGFSGPNPAPPYPGEDFISNAPAGLTFPTDLSNGTIVVSVEPAPDDSPAPFALKPLVGQVPGDVAVGAPQALGAGPVGITGVATLATSSAAPAAPAAPAAGADVAAPDAAAQPQELAFTGVESWYLAGGASFVILLGAAFVLSARRFEEAKA